MGKYKELVEDHLNARIARNKRGSDVLGTLKGEVETISKGSSEDIDIIVETAAKKMHKSLETIGTEESKMEMEILYPYLPKTMTEDEVKVELDKLDLKSMSNFGQRMGTAMKVLGSRADGKVVKSVIGKYYN